MTPSFVISPFHISGAIRHEEQHLMPSPAWIRYYVAICRAACKMLAFVTPLHGLYPFALFTASSNLCKQFVVGVVAQRIPPNPALNLTRNSGRVLFNFHSLSCAIAVRLALRYTSLPHTAQPSRGLRANISSLGPLLTVSITSWNCSGLALCFPRGHSHH